MSCDGFVFYLRSHGHINNILWWLHLLSTISRLYVNNVLWWLHLLSTISRSYKQYLVMASSFIYYLTVICEQFLVMASSFIYPYTQKRVKILKDHPMIICVHAGLNQISNFWEKNIYLYSRRNLIKKFLFVCYNLSHQLKIVPTQHSLCHEELKNIFYYLYI